MFFRFDIAVNYAGAVSGAESLSDLHGKPQSSRKL